MSTPVTTFDRVRALSTRSASVRWTLRLVRWAITLVITFTGLLAVTFVIGRKVPIDPELAILGDRPFAAAFSAALLELGPYPTLAVALPISSPRVLHGHF